MFKKKNVLILIALLAVCACEKDDTSQSTVSVLAESLEEKATFLNRDPLQWNNSELEFLDEIADKQIIGLGEATHGTKEFFNAKHRIFKYLVKEHDYKAIAFEADWGESLLINRAVVNGDASQIESLMKDRMLFWIWKTQEIKNLLVWMCEYNKGKADDEKIHYLGIDCQSNVYNTQILKEYLTSTNFPQLDSAKEVLDRAKQATKDKFSSYNTETFEAYLHELSGLKNEMDASRTHLIEQSSLSDFKLQYHTLTVIEQVSKQIFYDSNDRDNYMAKNVKWINHFFENGKTSVWAHNAHIANRWDGVGLMGYYLKQNFGNEYGNVGFLFTTGSFRARGIEGENYTDPIVHRISAKPKENSLNSICYQVDEPAYFFNFKNLLKNNNKWSDYSSILQIGASYSKDKNYYSSYNGDFMDYFIYFNSTRPSELLQ